MLRKKPFSESGGGKVSGYRDCLIWESVVGVAKETSDVVAFITNNTHDFALDGELHPDLASDLEDNGLEKETVVLYTSLQEFVDERIKPGLAPNEEIRRALASGRYLNLDLGGALCWRGGVLLAGQELDPTDIWPYSELESPSISDIERIWDLLVQDVRTLVSGELLIDTEFWAECYFDAFMFKADYYASGLDERGSISLEDSDWNDHMVRVSTVETVRITASATANAESGELTSLEIASIRGPAV